jgi:phage gp46-like protein
VGDVAISWENGRIDLTLSDGDVATDDGMRSSILESVFTDRRAEIDDDIPSGDGDRRGWWADQFADSTGDRFGSRLWLLDRSARRDDVLQRAKEYIAESLEWMLADKVAARIDVETEFQGELLAIGVVIHRPSTGPETFRFLQAWEDEEPSDDVGPYGSAFDAAFQEDAFG